MLTVMVKGGGGNGLYIRFLDADRKLRHPDMGAKN
jgi:hypothetical protein